MYKVELLLGAIDSVMESAENRLTAPEMELLALIRAGIAENKSQQAVEDHFMLLFNFLLLVKEYIENIT